MASCVAFAVVPRGGMNGSHDGALLESGWCVFSQMLGWGIAQFGYPAAFAMAAVLHPVAVIVLIVLLRLPGRQRPAHTTPA
jgi:hypothetical protein